MTHRELGGTPDDRLAVTLDEAARLLSVSTSMVKRVIAKGDIRELRIGRRRLVPMTSIRAFLLLPDEQRDARAKVDPLEVRAEVSRRLERGDSYAKAIEGAAYQFSVNPRTIRRRAPRELYPAYVTLQPAYRKEFIERHPELAPIVQRKKRSPVTKRKRSRR